MSVAAVPIFELLERGRGALRRARGEIIPPPPLKFTLPP
jgi:hypothetical protein